MYLSTTYKGHPISVHVDDTGKAEFTSADLTEGKDGKERMKRYDTEKAICAAFDRLDLSQRKDFTNPTAYRIGGRWNDNPEATAVTVTSVEENGYYAWIRQGKDKEKVPMSSLYADKAEVEAYCKLKVELTEQINKGYENLTTWKPKKG